MTRSRPERTTDPMTRKAVFVDVDGTLIDDYGQVPESAARAVREARTNGHLVFLCTGRSMVELTAFIGFANMATRSNTAHGIESQGFSTACEIPLAARPEDSGVADTA